MFAIHKSLICNPCRVVSFLVATQRRPSVNRANAGLNDTIPLGLKNRALHQAGSPFSVFQRKQGRTEGAGQISGTAAHEPYRNLLSPALSSTSVWRRGRGASPSAGRRRRRPSRSCYPSRRYRMRSTAQRELLPSIHEKSSHGSTFAVAEAMADRESRPTVEGNRVTARLSLALPGLRRRGAWRRSLGGWIRRWRGVCSCRHPVPRDRGGVLLGKGRDGRAWVGRIFCGRRNG